MLLQNRSQIAASAPHKRIGGTTTTTDGAGVRSVLGIKSHLMLQQYTSADIQSTSSTPVGYQPGSAIFPPMRSGGLGVGRGFIEGSGNVTNADLINAIRLILAALSGSGNITNALGRNTIPAAADLTGSGDVTDAALVLIANAIADLAGSGSISAGLAGSLSAVANLSGSGDVTDAALGAIAGMLAGLSGQGQLAAQPYAVALMAAAINVTGGTLTTANVAEIVWSALAAANNTSGTMGQKLNSAASGGVDYDALADAVWDDEFVDKLLTVAKFLGLK